MGSLFSPKNTTQTSKYTPPSYITDALQGLVGNAQSTYQTQSQQPTTNALQNTAFGSLSNVNQIASPYINQAAGLATAGTTPYTYSPVGASDISQYESPYNQDVINATQNQFNLQNAQQQNSLKGDAASAHALGGDRVGVAQAQLAGQQQANQAPTIAGLYNQNYAQALGEANTQQQTGIAAANSNAYRQLYGAGELGSLGQELQGTTLAGTGAQLQAGSLQQQLPYQNEQTLAGILGQAGGLAGGTTTGQTPGPSLASQLAGLGLSAASFFNRGGELKAFDEGGFLDDDEDDSIAPNDNGGGEGVVIPPSATGLAAATPQGISHTSVPLAANTTAPTSMNPFGMDDKHAALLQAGLGILGSRAPGTFAPIGEGAQSGLKAYQQQQALRGQMAYRSAMSQAALERAENQGQHYNNQDHQWHLVPGAKTFTFQRLGADGQPELKDTGLVNPMAAAATSRAASAAENASTNAAGTNTVIGTDGDGKPIFANNRTMRTTTGAEPIFGKPAPVPGPGKTKALTPDAAMAQARHDYDIIFPKPDPISGGTRNAPPEGIMNWIKKRQQAYAQGSLDPNSVAAKTPAAQPAAPAPSVDAAIANAPTDAAALAIANKASAALKAHQQQTTPKFTEGQIYTDKHGNKAKYTNGQFVAVP